MLSHLRFHRRGGSNPTSPLPDQQQSFSPVSNSESPQTLERDSPQDGFPKSTSSSSIPPTLPPIPRVTSTDVDPRQERLPEVDAMPDGRSNIVVRSSYNVESGFIGGVALRNYRRDAAAQQKANNAEPVTESGRPSFTDEPVRQQRASQVDASDDASTMDQSKHATSFTTPTELQASGTTLHGRRPPGPQGPQESPAFVANAVTVEPQKAKRSLPFLKNPMSTLLMRRRNNQNAPDVRPLPLRRQEEPSYDPRIRGTRVHDFSAPRRQKEIYGASAASSRSASDVRLATSYETRRSREHSQFEDDSSQRDDTSTHISPASSKSMSPHELRSRPSASSDKPKHSISQRQMITDTQLPPISSGQHQLSNETPHVPVVLSSSVADASAESSMKPSASTRTTRSRNISLSEASAIPKHMKSTSSRFSFDMTGAAKQERLLEERHRQKELERQTTDDDNARDSRFDDFDEDALYDAMMDEDDFEEPIPEVDAGYDEDDFPDTYNPSEELDPDNDQENFSGFVFQRSNPTSSLASPYGVGLMATPRDADGNVIGYAMTKDTPSAAEFQRSPNSPHSHTQLSPDSISSGLGIREVRVQETTGVADSQAQDDLYFDDGLIGYEDEFAEDLAAPLDSTATPFDESIFDNDDTDEFGRPVPGAFQQAQSLRLATRQPLMKRESDMVSHASAQTGITQSTAHTSLSAGWRSAEEAARAKSELSLRTSEAPNINNIESGETPVVAYQAALAAAAHKAAASGKFHRDSSPTTQQQLEMGDTRVPESYGIQNEDLYPSYDDDDDDFDFDDDAIIAEANASALANDSDGWYGQEFGFYSAPPGGHVPSHTSSSSSLNDYAYSSGGFFGPDGPGDLNRSTSGRMISREPNLTPITERSEYSNRNSLMSLGIPALSSSTPAIQSPGLAQLAMMADNGDDQMTLSALMRLRSRAWGGSQASLSSSRDASPRSERGDMPSSPWTASSLGPGLPTTFGHARKTSAFSTVSHDSDVPSASGSPTMTFGGATTLGSMHHASVPQDFDKHQLQNDNPWYPAIPSDADDAQLNDAPLAVISERSSVDASSLDEGYEMKSSYHSSFNKGHRHKSSADSVSYFQEEDSGETRWVLERRRTGESGQVQVLEREFIEGGRI